MSEETDLDFTVTLRAEFKPLLSIVNVLIGFSRTLLSDTSRVIVEPHKISVHSQKICNIDFILNGLTLKPSTCRGLRWISSLELQLTLEAEWVSKDGDTDDLKISNDFPAFNQDLIVSRIKTCQSLCFCVGCRERILKASCHFKRVLPLPSENWSDFADIWFCHNHEAGSGHTHSHVGESTIPKHINEVKNNSLSPRRDDCLVSSLYMLVSAHQVKKCSVGSAMDKLVCKRCGNFLGFVKKAGTDTENKENCSSKSSNISDEVYKLYFHAVCFKDKGEDTAEAGAQLHPWNKSNIFNNSEQPFTEFVCHLLRDQSQKFTSFRFIIESSMQCEQQSKVTILLWLLDQELAVLSLLSSALDLKKKTSSDPALKPSKSASSPPGSACIVSDVKPQMFIKLLYKVNFLSFNECHEKGQTVFDAWQKDNTVHPISLPYPLCKQLIRLLIDSTKELSVSQRSLNAFHVAYLKAS